MKKILAPSAPDSFIWGHLLVAGPAPLSFRTRGGGGAGGCRIQGPGPATPPCEACTGEASGGFFFVAVGRVRFLFGCRSGALPFWMQVACASFLDAGRVRFLFGCRSRALPFWMQVACASFLDAGCVRFLFGCRLRALPFWMQVACASFLDAGCGPIKRRKSRTCFFVYTRCVPSQLQLPFATRDFPRKEKRCTWPTTRKRLPLKQKENCTWPTTRGLTRVQGGEGDGRGCLAKGGRYPPCDIPSGCCSFTGPWTVTRSSLRMLRRVAAFCRPLRPVLPLVLFPRSRRPVVGVLGLCWMWRDVPFACQRCPVVGVLGAVLRGGGTPPPSHWGMRLLNADP